ncbi:hypothetical protein HAX54_050542 [Datura stramonium]|uniref:Uncharacterized protein n=1 Tax=Datura stramonium TaxID=4076 RepID=A0ABS8WLJ6_DATST|nr:hypothetical protein [Datura stramonium]
MDLDESSCHGLTWSLSGSLSRVTIRVYVPVVTGYDLTSGDYKILKIDQRSHCEILALKCDSWKKFNKHPNDINPAFSDDMKDSLAFVDGAFHWHDSFLNKPMDQAQFLIAVEESCMDVDGAKGIH